MKKYRLISHPVRRSDLSFEDLIDNDWELKAEQLQERRWRKMRREFI